MPVKIGFTIVCSTGEDERYRATELNYHGPTVRGWRSAANCPYPQEIILQLNVTAVLHRIQILSHQYLIPQKIEIWTGEGYDYDPSLSPGGADAFDYLGFITLSDNQSTGFKSRELKSITVPPTTARYIKLRLHANHGNDKNLYNQVGLIAVNVLGEEVPELDDEEVNNNGNYCSQSESTLISNPQYVSPYDDLAFEMYVDKDVARIMRVMEAKKHQAVLEERFEYASKLKTALEDLRGAGETLGKYEQEKRQAINTEDYDKAKLKKLQIDQYREQVYRVLRIDELLEMDGPLEENDLNSGSLVNRTLRKQELTPPVVESAEQSRSPDHDYLPPQMYFKSPTHFARPQTPNLQHSQSQTSFDEYAANAESPPPCMSSSTSNPHLVYASRHLQPSRFRNWPSAADSAYHSMPTPQVAHSSSSPGAEFPVPQRNYSDGEIKAQLVKTVDFDSPIAQTMDIPTTEEAPSRSPTDSNASLTQGTATQRPGSVGRGSLRRRNKSTGALKSSYEAYEERMLPALRHYHTNEIVRECQLGVVEPAKKSKLNEREKKQAALPISVFGIDMVEKFYSKNFADKEEGLKQLQEELKRQVGAASGDIPAHSPNKIARAAIFLLHRALRDKVYSVYSSAADTIRLFFSEYVPDRVSSAEIARSVERLLPELIAKSGDATPRIHNMAAHTLLSMADCKEVRDLHIIPVHLSRPLTSSVHPRLALSRLEMIEQLILNQGISTDKQSGLTCRTLAEFGSSGLHHPAEAVRKVSERILIQVYRVNPRLVRKQLPPDDDITRRNLLYRQLFQEFDFMDLQRKREMNEKQGRSPSLTRGTDVKAWESPGAEQKTKERPAAPKKTVNQQTSPTKPLGPAKEEPQPFGILRKGKAPVPEKPKLDKRKTGIPDAAEGPAQEDVTLKFPNLVDSVRVAEERLSFTQKGIRNLKSLKYIFPTTYIGNSTTSQAAVTASNTVNSVCKVKKPQEWKPQGSGIPVPTNGRLMTPAVAAKKAAKTWEESKTKTENGDDAEDKPGDEPAEDKTKETGSSGSSNSSPSDGGARPKSAEPKQTFKMCIFCFASDNWFTEESLNVHYWKSCPMLTRCVYCKEVVEISGLIQHRLEDCEHRHLFVKCETCQEAVPTELVNDHDCIASESKNHKTRCPLCHADIGKEEDWREHLMGSNVCPNHPRRAPKVEDEDADKLPVLDG